MRSYEDSLQRLGLAKIDILYVHDIGRLTHGDDHERTFAQLTTGGGFRALERLRRGSPVFIEGQLRFEKFQVRGVDGVMVDRTKHSITVETWMYMESKAEGEARLSKQATADDAEFGDAHDVLPDEPAVTQPKPEPKADDIPSNRELTGDKVPTPKKQTAGKNGKPPTSGSKSGTAVLDHNGKPIPF